MENAWQAKCAPTLASSISSVASSVQVPSQISKNQIETNMGYCIQLRDVRQSRFWDSAMTQVPPSQQSDFQHASNRRVLSSSYPANLRSAALTSSFVSIPNQRLTHDPRDYNHGFGVDVCPLLPSRVLASSGRTGVPFLRGGQDSARPSVTHAGPVQNDSRNVYFAQEAYMVSSNASSGRMPHGSKLCTSKKSHPVLSSFHRDQPSPVMGSSRVFCMNKSGDLLLSNTGLLAVVCSCHGLQMSISNFCEHSGFSNVIPGYAVHVDTGETLAQWRKVYFSKRGIRIPEDHKGWEWPEELLSTVGIPRCSAPDGGIKCSGFSDRVCTSVEPECTTRSCNNFFAGYPHLSQKQIAAVSQIDQPGNSYYQHNIFSAGLPVSPESNMHNKVNDYVKACPSPNGFTLMKSLSQGGLCNGGQLISSSCNMVSQTGNSYSESLRGLIVKAQTNENISVVQERGATSSCIELKLGQPSEKCRSLESPANPAVPSQISDPRKIISQQRILYTISAPGETDCPQYAHLDTGLSSPIRTEKQPVSNHAFVASITNMFGNIETSNNDLSRHSRISVPPTYLATSSGGMSYEKTTMPPNDGHHFIPWTRHFQHQAVKSGQICIAGGTASIPNADGAVRPSDKSACLSSANKSTATGHSNSSLASSETSFQLYAKQMEKMGFFNRDTHGNYQFSPVNGKNQLSSMVPNILDTSKPPEESGERNCKSSAHVKNIARRNVDPSTRFGLTFPSQESYMVMPPSTANPAPSLKYVVPNEKELCFGPSKLGESLRNLALVDPAKHDEMNALLWSNAKLQSGGPDLKMRGSLLDLLPSEEQIEKPNFTYKYSMSESTTKLFSPVLSCQVNNNVGISSSTSGANLKNLTACRNGFTSYYGETSKHCHGCHDPLASGLPLKGAGIEAASQDTCKKCSQREYNVKRCNCISDMLSSNKESEFGGTSSTCGLKKYSPSSEAFKICALGNHIGCSPEKKTILVEKGMVKGLMHEGLESSISQLIGVPPNVKGDCRLMCTHEPAHGIGRGESRSEFKDFSPENDPRASMIDDSFKGNELNIPSGCSGPAARQVSVEVSKASSSIVDTEDPVYESDQIVDQGSAVDKCFLPDDATLSQTSSEHLYSSAKIKSIRDHCPKSLYNSDCINRMIGHKQCNILRIKEVQSHGLASVKRKRRTNWTTLGTSFSPVGVALSPYKSPSDRGDPAGQQYRLAKNGGMLSKSLEDSCDAHQDFSRDPSSKRRKTALSLLQGCSRKSHLDRDSDSETMEDNSETEHNNKPDSVNLPDIVAVKKLKQDNSTEAADKLRLQKVNLNNAGAVLKSNLVGFTKENYDKQEDFQRSKMKPIVCGMYGIISSRENILQLPKIFSLSQVLKTARKFEVEPQLTSLKESKKRSLEGGLCGFGNGEDSRCNKFRRLSRNIGTSSRGSDETSSFADCPHPSGWSVTHKQGLDKTKTNNTSMSNIWRRAQFKPKFKAVRRRSLYELFMEGEKLSSKHEEDLKNISCTLSKQCTYEMKTYENVGNSDKQLDHSSGDSSGRSMGLKGLPLLPQIDSFCCVCGKSNEDQTNCLLECSRCSIRIHQACYGISRLPKGHWYCRPCSTNSVDTVCVLCGYEGGAMTQALRCDNVVKSLLKAWNIPAESGTRNKLASSEAFNVAVDMEFCRISTRSIMVHNSVTAGLFDPTVKQWIHMVCGLWTPGTRCPNVHTMSSFDVSGVSHSKPNIVCAICKRRGGSSIKCRVLTCSSQFHPWCAHLKGLLQSEPEGVNNEKIGFYGRCMIHAMSLPSQAEADLDNFKIKGRHEATCARTEGYMGRKQDGKRYNASYRSKGKGRCLVSLEQLNAWLHINRKIMSLKPSLNSSISDIEHDFKKEYARYKQIKGWKQLMVYKSGIHALGLYTCLLIRRGAMVVEYVGEIVGLRVADKREIEYQSGRKLQYKSACYFFRIDKEQIVDATRKGGIARFVNHSCTPNCVAKIITIRNEKKVVFFAQRDIYPGEEITYDYHFNNEDEGKKIPCFCNSRNCRLYLN